MSDAAPARKEFVVVLGSGSFGTALATVCARRGHDTTILGRNDAICDALSRTHRHPHVLTEFDLPTNLHATTDPAVLKAATVIIHTVPVQSSLPYLEKLRDFIPRGCTLVVCSKGLYSAEREGESGGGGQPSQGPRPPLLMVDVVALALSGLDVRVAVLSGPTFARELMLGYPTGAVVGCVDMSLAKRVAGMLDQPAFRPYVSTDVVGIEVAGALKNVYAIAAGAVEGIGLGANTTALLVTRAVAEMNTLATGLGSTEPTLAGLAGVGDLMLTCYGAASRNRSVGVRLGRGEALPSILESMTEVAEGVATAPAALALAQHKGLGHRVPIIHAIVDVLEGRRSAGEALQHLLAIPIGREHIMDGVECGGRPPPQTARRRDDEQGRGEDGGGTTEG